MANEFFQQGPKLANQFAADTHLQRILPFFLRQPLSAEWNRRLQQVGEDASGKLLNWSQQAENEKPKHIPFDAWGNRIDEIQTSEAWNLLNRYAAEHALIATGYERTEGPLARLLQMSLLYLYHPSSAFFSCPLAMTDGAARALEVYGNDPEHKNAFQHLVSRDPTQFWTSGQWMTEKTGGSDVGQTLTTARMEKDSTYRLYGTKWFTSATTSQMAMTLARPEGAEGGGRGLSLFFIRLRDEEGRLRNIRIHRLKEKLGTDGLPTAELALDGTPASLVGGEGQGIKKIATLFNVTRIYNAICSIGTMQRGLVLANDYSKKRMAFGKTLAEQPLHLVTLQELAVEKAACTVLTFRTAELWGKDDCAQASEEEAGLLRLMTTLAKLYTGKKAVQFTSEVLEIFGGAGYVEDTGLPRLLRDAQVFPIWEGTTNVLSLDVLRALSKECPFEVFVKDVSDRLGRVAGGSSSFANERKTVLEQLQRLGQWMATQAKATEVLTLNARGLAFELSEIMIKSLLIEVAATTQHAFDTKAAQIFCARPSWIPREKLSFDLS